MILVCPKCHVRYRLSERQIPAKKEFLARCSRCRHVFTAYRPERIQEIGFRDLASAKKRSTDRRVIAISNQKGGVAKTTTCLNLGMALASPTRRVLLVDFDGQANLSISLGHPGKWSFFEAVQAPKRPLTDFIIATQFPGLSLLPSGNSLVLLNKRYFGADGFEYILKDRLHEVMGQFDTILVDTPPSVEFFTLNALTAAGLAIIPSPCDFFSTHGVDRILNLIGIIRKKSNPGLEARILVALFDPKDVASQVIHDKMKRLYGQGILDTVIPWDPRIKESQILALPVIHYDKQSVAGRQYTSLGAEILRKFPVIQNADS